MKISGPAAELARALELGVSVLDPSIKIEAARAVHITAGAGAIVVTVNALDRAVSTSCPATVTEPGEVAVRAAALAGLVGNFPADAIVTVETSNIVMLVNCGHAAYRLPTIPLPSLPAPLVISDELGRAELDRDRAIRAFAVPLFAADAAPTRPYLNGIFAINVRDNIVTVGTNGRQLVRLSVPATGALSSDRRVIIPLPSARVINKLLTRTKGDSGRILLRRSRSLFELTGPGFVFVTKLIDAEYPAYERVVPGASDHTATVDRRALGRALERLAAAVDPADAWPAAAIEWRDGAVHLGLHHQPDAADDGLSAETSGVARVVAGLGPLAQIVDEFAGATVKLDCTDNTTAIRITDPADPDLLVLLMPIAERPRRNPATTRSCPARRRGRPHRTRQRGRPRLSPSAQ